METLDPNNLANVTGGLINVAGLGGFGRGLSSLMPFMFMSQQQAAMTANQGMNPGMMMACMACIMASKNNNNG
jgi:hypothetical protein